MAQQNLFMKNLLILFILASIAFSANAQKGQKVTVFKTYEDYVNNKGRVVGKFTSFFYSMSAFKIISGRGKKKESINMKKTWGFMLADSMLFRMDGIHPSLVVFVTDKIVFYENGALILNGLLPSDERRPAVGTPCFLSTDLQGKIKGIPGGAPGLFKDVPEVKEFIDCAKWKNQYDRAGIRECWYEHIGPNLQHHKFLPEVDVD